MRPILGILGATGVGKSVLAVDLALKFDTDIISADSMQVYIGMDIGTAKINAAETKGVKHYMIDVVTPDKDFSAFMYAEMAEKILQKEFTDKVPIMVGGTGLYFDSLIYGFDNPANEQTLQVRKEMNKLYNDCGSEALLKVLEKLDKRTFEVIDRKNIKRVIRAIEIASQGGSMYGERKAVRQAKHQSVLFVLTRNREQLYRNIDSRVDKMVAEGLVDEVEKLVKQYPSCSSTAFQAIGYKEIVAALNGAISVSDAIDLIKLNTRHYAKRQLSYFKRMKANWIDVDEFERERKSVADYVFEQYSLITNLNY